MAKGSSGISRSRYPIRRKRRSSMRRHLASSASHDPVLRHGSRTGVMNITLLQFETEEDAGDERGKDFIGVHHFGVLVNDIEATKHAIEAHGGKYHPGPTGHAPASAEYKFRDPNGIVFDISTQGWDGAKR